MKQQKLIGFVLLALLMVMAACSRDDNQTTEATPTGVTAETVLVNEPQPGLTTGETTDAAAAPTAVLPAGEVTAVDPTATPPPADAATGGMAGNTSTAIVTQHTVQEREWLHQIARCYGTSPQEIVAANNLPHPGWIMAGEVWQIPNVGSVANPIGPPCIIYYTVKGGDTLLSISRTYSVPLDVLMFTNYGCAGYNAHYDMTYRPIPVPHPAPHVDGQIYYADYYYGYGYLGGCTYYSYPTIYPGNLLVIPVNYENMGLR